MWTIIIILYKGSSEARKLVMNEKLKRIKMSKLDSVVSCLNKFPKVREKLSNGGETVQEMELVNFVVLGFTKSWEAFTFGICA